MRDAGKMSYRDKLARHNRLIFVLKLFGLFSILGLAVGGGVYFLFFTDKLEIREITLNGIQTLDSAEILATIERQLDKSFLGFLFTQKNILFFKTDKLKEELLSQNEVLKDISVEKNYPRGLAVNFLERKPIGIWCVAGECRYFDKELATWGEALPSSGFLLLSVEDKREPVKSSDDDHGSGSGFGIDQEFFRGINEMTENLSYPSVGSVIIPADSFDEFRVYTDKNYYLIFALDSDIKSQTEVLGIFLAENEDKPGFNPQYIDLRIDGRVYYR